MPKAKGVTTTRKRGIRSSVAEGRRSIAAYASSQPQAKVAKREEDLDAFDAINPAYYSAWRVVLELMLGAASKQWALAAWDLSCTCSALHASIGKQTWEAHWLPHPNFVAMAHAERNDVCCRCKVALSSGGSCVFRHPLHVHHPPVCGQCERECSEFSMVSATTAESEFHVKPGAVATLENYHWVSGQWGSYKSYLVSDLTTLPKKRVRGDETKRRMAAAKKQKQDARRALLTEALAALGLEIREDSKLCADFIAGRADPEDRTVPQIAMRMAEMKMLHEYWGRQFAQCRSRALTEAGHGDARIRGYEIAEEAEALVLQKHGGRYPERWPWLPR